MTTDQPARVLIAFGTWHGQTERIAEKLGDFARRLGYRVTVESAHDARARRDLALFDRIVVCAGVQAKGHHREAELFVADNIELLSRAPTAFVSVSLSAAAPEGSDSRIGIQKVVDDFLAKTHWTPGHVILAAGALHYTRYNVLVRWMMRRISRANGGPTDTSRDYVMTDWAALERGAAEVFPELATGHHRVAVL